MPIEFCGEWGTTTVDETLEWARRDGARRGEARRSGRRGEARRSGRSEQEGTGRGEEEGHLSVGFGRLGLNSIHMCTHNRRRQGRGLSLLLLVSSLNFKKERRNKTGRGPSATITFYVTVHMCTPLKPNRPNLILFREISDYRIFGDLFSIGRRGRVRKRPLRSKHMATLDLSLRDARVPLGVSTAFVINKAYHTRALECHPDKNPTTNPPATQDLSTARDCALRDVSRQYARACEVVAVAPAGCDRPPNKRKRTGVSRSKKQLLIKSATSEGGFVDKGRMTYRAEGGILATGNERSCLPDALYVLVRGLDHPVELEDVRTIMPVHGDTLFSVRLAPVPSWSPAPPPSRGTHTPCSPLLRLLTSTYTSSASSSLG